MANEKFKINGVVSEVVPTIGTTGDILKKTVSGVEWGSLDKATQAEAEAGTNDTKIMTPLRVKQVTEQYATKAELANIDLTEELENLATKTELADKVDKVSGKQLSTNDYTTTEKNKLSGIQAGAQVNAVTSVNGQTGAVTTPDTTYNAATTSVNGLMSSADKVKLNGVETGAQKNSVTSVQGRTGAVTISKSDVGLGSVNNVAITAAQVTKINELNYTRAMTQAQYDALSTSEKNRTDVWYGIYK